VPELLRLAGELTVRDGEDVALSAALVVSELHKAYRPALEESAAPFLAHVAALYANFEAAAAHHFGADARARPAGEPGLAEGGAQGGQGSPAPPACSFRLLTDLPLTVMFLLQLYPKSLMAPLRQLLPPMLACLGSGAVAGGAASLPLHLRGVYGDMRAAQVKAVSFVTFVMRSMADDFRPHAPLLARSVVFLLRTCPDRVSVRKELLVATRHMVGSSLLRATVLGCGGEGAAASPADALLDEAVLLGPGLAAREALRMLAFSLVSEMVSTASSAAPQQAQAQADAAQQQQPTLSLAQLGKAVRLYGAALRDPTQPLALASACTRLVLGCVRLLFTPRFRAAPDGGEREQAVQLLGSILMLLAERLAGLARLAPAYAAAAAAATATAAAAAPAPAPAPAAGESPLRPAVVTAPSSAGGAAAAFLLHRSPIPGNPARPLPAAVAELADARLLLRTLLPAIKTVVWSVAHFAAPQAAPPGAASAASLLSDELLSAVARVAVLTPPAVAALYAGAQGGSAAAAVAECFDGLSALLTQLAPRSLTQLLPRLLPSLFRCPACSAAC